MEAWKANPSLPLPAVPFEWLTSFELTAKQWAGIADRMGWQALRMNLNTLARKGAFGVAGVTDTVALRLRDPAALARVRPMPYQLQMALAACGEGVPLKVQAALEDALTQALGRADILNVGGFSDAVFDTIARFAAGETRDWVSIVEAREV